MRHVLTARLARAAAPRLCGVLGVLLFVALPAATAEQSIDSPEGDPARAERPDAASLDGAEAVGAAPEQAAPPTDEEEPEEEGGEEGGEEVEGAPDQEAGDGDAAEEDVSEDGEPDLELEGGKSPVQQGPVPGFAGKDDSAFRKQLQDRPIRKARGQLSSVQRRVAQQELVLQDLRRERRGLERDLGRLPADLIAGRLNGDELRQRIGAVLAAGNRFDSLADSTPERLNEALADLQAVSAEWEGAQATGAATQELRRVLKARVERNRDLCTILLRTSEEASTASAVTGTLSTLLTRARQRAPLMSVMHRFPFPVSRDTTTDLSEALSALQPGRSEDVDDSALVGLQTDDLPRQLPLGCVAILIALGVLLAGCRKARRGREILAEHTSVSARRERATTTAGLHLLALLASYVVLQLLLAAFVAPLWRGIFNGTWIAWALWILFRSLSPWVTVVRPRPGESASTLERRPGPATAAQRALLWTALAQPALLFLRNVDGMPMSVPALAEVCFGIVLLALLTPCGVAAFRVHRTAGRPVRGTGWCVLFVLASYLLLFVYLAGYQNLARYLAATAPLVAAVIMAAWCSYFAVSYWLRELVSRPDLDSLEPWERSLEDALRKGMAVAPTLVSTLVALLALPVANLRAWHLGKGLALLQRPLFAVQGSTFSVFSAGKAILVIYVAWWIAKLMRRKLQEASVMQRRYDSSVRYAAATVAYYLVLIIGVVVGFLAAGLNLSVFTVFSATLGLAVGFGSQDIAKNFISGLILILDRSAGVGDYVEVAGQQGTIEQINIRCTTIRTPDNRKVVVPNATFVAQNVIGSPQRDRRMRLLVEFLVAGQVDLAAVQEALLNVAQKTEGVVADPPPEVWVTKLAAANVTFQLAVWLARPEDNVRVQGLLTTAGWHALQEKQVAAG